MIICDLLFSFSDSDMFSLLKSLVSSGAISIINFISQIKQIKLLYEIMYILIHTGWPVETKKKLYETKKKLFETKKKLFETKNNINTFLKSFYYSN